MLTLVCLGLVICIFFVIVYHSLTNLLMEQILFYFSQLWKMHVYDVNTFETGSFVWTLELCYDKLLLRKRKLYIMSWKLECISVRVSSFLSSETVPHMHFCLMVLIVFLCFIDVVGSAAGFTVFTILLSSWALTFIIGGKHLFGHVWDELVMYNVADKLGLTGWS